MAILVDASVLVRVRDLRDPNQSTCERVLAPPRASQLGLCVCTQSLIEYRVVATRPAAQNGLGLPPEEVARDIDHYIGYLPCVPEPPDVVSHWLRLVRTHAVIGKTAHDARLVALMDAHGIDRIVSLNLRDFARYRHIRFISPGQLLSTP